MSHPDPEIVLTTDVVLFAVVQGKLSVLSIRRHRPPFAEELTLPGGYLRVGETSEHGATRVLAEKTGLRDMHIEQLYSSTNPAEIRAGIFVRLATLPPATSTTSSCKTPPWLPNRVLSP